MAFWGILADARQTCEPGALKQRFKALKCFVHLLEEVGCATAIAPIFATLVPELLLGSRQVGGAVRKGAWNGLQTLAKLCVDSELQMQFATTLCAGLAGLQAPMRAAAVDALARLVYEHKATLSEMLRREISATVFVLAEDTDKQVIKTLLGFLHVLVSVCGDDDLAAVLPTAIGVIGTEAANNFRPLVRKCIDKMLRRVPYDMLKDIWPEEHVPLLNYVQRMQERKARRKFLPKPETFDDLIEEERAEEAEDSEQSVDAESDDDRLVSRKPIKRRVGKKSKREETTTTMITEGEEVLDFRSPGASQSVVSTTKKAKRRKVEATSNLTDGVSVDAAGKIVVDEAPTDDDESADDPDELIPARKALAGLKSIRQMKQDKALRKKGHTITGMKQFKGGKKAKGDAIRKAKMEPFAYVKLKRSLTAEKKKAHSMASFSAVVGKQRKRGKPTRAARHARVKHTSKVKVK